MSVIRFHHDVDIAKEIRCQCLKCGGALYSEGGEYQQGSPLVVKVKPRCLACEREREKEMKAAG